MVAFVCVSTYMLEAAADAGLDVAPAKGRHLTQLPRDLNGIMQQKTQLPLVTCIAR